MDYQLYYNIEEVRDLNKESNKEELKSSLIVKQELLALWQECFGDSDSYTNFYFNWKVKDNQILSIYKHNKLCSMLHLNPYSAMVQGKKTPVNYIVGVATKQQERRQGLMKLLIEASLQKMYESHMPLTYLMPAAEAIYLPFDFRIVYEQEPWNQIFIEQDRRVLRIASMTPSSQDNLNVIPLKSSNSKKIDDLVAFSNYELSKRFDIYIERTPYYFVRLIHEMESTGGEVLLCYQKDELIGYASYMAEGSIYITEFISKQSNKDDVIDALTKYLDNLAITIKEIIKTPSIMARIVDWKVFIQNISASEHINLVIKVSDQILKENCGVYLLKFTKKGCQIEKTIEKEEISADIADLTSLFFGCLKEADLNKIIAFESKKEVIQKIKKINKYRNVFINDVV